jgi:hypothetical protein
MDNDDEETIKIKRMNYNQKHYLKYKDIRLVCEFCSKRTTALGIKRHQQGTKCRYMRTIREANDDIPEDVRQIQKLEEFYRSMS